MFTLFGLLVVTGYILVLLDEVRKEPSDFQDFF